MWGEDGYIRMERNVNDTTGKCGIAMMASYPIKEGQNPPKPSPSPPTPVKPPTVCDNSFSCSRGTTCCCVYEDYDNECLAWGCCPFESAICCEDHFSCCPHDYPICDVYHGTCLMVIHTSIFSLLGLKPLNWLSLFVENDMKKFVWKWKWFVNMGILKLNKHTNVFGMNMILIFGVLMHRAKTILLEWRLSPGLLQCLTSGPIMKAGVMHEKLLIVLWLLIDH